MTRRALVCALALAVGAVPVAAQTNAQRLTAQARVQLDDINADSARTLAIAALNAATAPAERVRAFTLLAIAELNRKNTAAARDAFVRAIGIEPGLRVDTLKALDSEVLTVFAAAKTIAAATPEATASLHLTMTVPADTMIAPDDARLPIVVQPTLNSRIVAAIAAVGRPNEILWSDSALASGRRVFTWPLRTQSGAVWPDGRYVLRAQATDSTGQATPFQERQLRIARARVDTQALPTPPAPSAFAPETLKVGTAKKRLLFAGGSLAAMVVATPMLGNPTLNKTVSSDPTAYAVAGGVALISLIDFIKTRAHAQVMPENVTRNQQLRASYQQKLDEATRANNEARLRAQIRIIVERSQ